MYAIVDSGGLSCAIGMLERSERPVHREIAEDIEKSAMRAEFVAYQFREEGSLIWQNCDYTYYQHCEQEGIATRMLFAAL